MTESKYAIYNPFKWPLQSRFLDPEAADTGGIYVDAGQIIKNIDPAIAEKVVSTGVFLLSRDNGRTWELDGKIGPNGEREPKREAV